MHDTDETINTSLRCSSDVVAACRIWSIASLMDESLAMYVSVCGM